MRWVWALVVANLLDLLTTLVGVVGLGLHEVNPLMRAAIETPYAWLFVTIKLSISAYFYYAGKYLLKENKMFIVKAIGILLSLVVLNNFFQLGRYYVINF